MNTVPKLHPATYADLEALPPHVTGQILYGSLHAETPLRPRHGYAAFQLNSAIPRRSESSSIYLSKPKLHLGPRVVVPDITGWKVERLTPFPTTAYIETPPDWLAEILSPSTQALDRTDKLAVYAEYGVKHCWYVDPLAKTLEVMELTGGKWLLLAALKDAAPVCQPPFEAYTFPLDNLWVPDPPA